MATVGLLAIMSLVSWSIIVERSSPLRKQKKRADHFYDRFYDSTDPFELLGQDEEFEGAPPFSVYDYACREMQKLLDRFAGTRYRRRHGSSRTGPIPWPCPCCDGARPR